MKIAVNTRFLLSGKMEGFGWYTYEITKRLVEQHPEYEFIFFFDRPFDPKFIFGSNVTPIVLNPPARHPVLFIYWFEFAIRKALKKVKADVFFSPDGYLSLRSKTPQISVIHDINFEHFPKDLPWSARVYLRHFFPLFAQKAEHIITVSEYSKQDIVDTYNISPQKITAIWNGASDVFVPINETEQLSIKAKYSLNKPFFLFVGSLHPRKNVRRLIEAFALFKEKTNSKHQLVIVGSSLWKNKAYQLVVSDQIKNEIHFTGHLHLKELSKVMATADALTFVPYFEGFGIPLVEAMKCGTPILCGDKTSLPEVAGEAAIYCDPFNVNDIAQKLELISQNNDLRFQLKIAGLERGKKFNWDKSAQHVWKVIQTVLKK
jgi:glycosyltransferase involved in cell wall biosynthesis